MAVPCRRLVHNPWSTQAYIENARAITRICASQDWYFHEILAKKVGKKGTVSTFNSQQDCDFFETFFCYKRKLQCAESPWNVFPSLFRLEMENAMFKDHPDNECVKDTTYFCDSGDGWTLHHLPPLSDQPILTDDDRRIIKMLNVEYVELMKRCVKKAKATSPPRYIVKMEKWSRRVERLGCQSTAHSCVGTGRN